MKYLVNVHRTMVSVPDIKKMVPFDPDNYTIWEIDEETFQKSMDLKKVISAKMLVDVTAEVLALKAQQGETTPEVASPAAAPEPVKAQETYEVFQPKSPLPPTPEGMPAPTLISKPHAPIMVDEQESSRALSGADANEHLQNVISRLRPGVDTADSSVIVDAHTTKEAALLAEKSRTSYIVEEESRSQLTVDPRFTHNRPAAALSPNVDSHLTQLATPTSPAPTTLNQNVVELNSVLINRIAQAAAENEIRKQQNVSRLTSDIDLAHQQHKNDPNWWQNSTFARERKAEQMQAQAYAMQQRANPNVEVDERILANQAYSDAAPNPILADIMNSGPESASGNSFLSNMLSETTATVTADASPLAALLTEADASESRSPKSGKRGTRGKRK